jgi:hypothetical protein
MPLVCFTLDPPLETIDGVPDHRSSPVFRDADHALSIWAMASHGPVRSRHRSEKVPDNPMMRLSKLYGALPLWRLPTDH